MPALKTFSMDSMESPEGSAEPGAEERPALDDPVHLLRTDWRFAAVIQFCRVFSAALKLRPFPADQLQAALLQPQEHSVFLQELVYRLLKNDNQPFSLHGASAAWEDLLQSRLDRSWHSLGLAAHPLGEAGDFFLLSPSQRVTSPSCRWCVFRF